MVPPPYARVMLLPGTPGQITSVEEGEDQGPPESWIDLRLEGEVQGGRVVAHSVVYDLGAGGAAYLDAAHRGRGGALACLTPGPDGVEGDFALVLMRATVVYPDPGDGQD